MKVLYIGLKRPSTILQIIAEVMDVGQFLSATIPLVTEEDILIEAYPGQNILSTLPLTTRKEELIMKVEVDIGLITDIISLITKVNVVDFWIFQIDTVAGDGIVGYIYQTSQYFSQSEDSRSDNAIHVIMYGDLNHLHLFNAV